MDCCASFPGKNLLSPRPGDYLRLALGLFTGERVRVEVEAAAARERDVSPYLDFDRSLRILDLANGRLQPQYLLLRNGGHCVIGIDLANAPVRGATSRAYGLARSLYNLHVPDRRRREPGHWLVCGDVSRLPFHSAAFDLVTSMSAFEHFLDVPGVVAEVCRVLRPGGLAWVRIHPFTCLTGGHNLSFGEVPVTHMPLGIEPWDHLRQRRHAWHVPLNEWRIDQYRSTFAQHFKILKSYCAAREGQALLTAQVAAELADYSDDELTCCTYAIVARKTS
jgi:SAM-dependent methyltransferase